MAKKPNSLDVARRASVSRTTVSYVMNDRQDLPIPQETRNRVLDAARELGYRHNHLARSLKSGRTMLLGVVLPGFDEPYMAGIVQGIESACRPQGYRILLADSQRDPQAEAEQVNLLLEHRVDGLICLPSENTLPNMGIWLDTVREAGTACVIVDDRTYGSQVDCVVSDDEYGARLATEHLLRRGCRRIAHLAGGPQASSGRDRRTGYLAALAAAGLTPDPALMEGNSFEAACAPAAVDRLLALAEPPDALFAANDVLAAEALEALRRRGRCAPEEIAVVGYGNMSWGRFLRLTTVDQDDQGIGRAAALRLFERIRAPQPPPETCILPTRLVVRETCGGRQI